MKLNIFKWKMSAASNKAAVDQLRTEIIAFAKAKRDFPLANILDLLPLQTEQRDEIVARGMIKFAGNKFSNIAASDLWVEFQDPVLRTFSTTIPANWTGVFAISADSKSIQITFDKALSLEIPSIAEQGIGRSMFQRYLSLQVSPSQAISVLKDSSVPDNETHIEVSLTAAGARAALQLRPQNLTVLSFFDSSNPCGSDPADPNWYVYQRIGGLSFVHYGQIIEGGQMAYTKKAGPATKAACDQYVKSDPTCL